MTSMPTAKELVALMATWDAEDLDCEAFGLHPCPARVYTRGDMSNQINAMPTGSAIPARTARTANTIALAGTLSSTTFPELDRQAYTTPAAETPTGILAQLALRALAKAKATLTLRVEVVEENGTETVQESLTGTSPSALGTLILKRILAAIKGQQTITAWEAEEFSALFPSGIEISFTAEVVEG